MKNSPADVARVGDRINPLNRVLRGCFRFLAPVLGAAGLCTAAQAQQDPNCDTHSNRADAIIYFNQSPGEITEGASATFKVIRGAGLNRDLAVTLDSSGSMGDFASGALPTSVTIPDSGGPLGVDVVVDTEDDNVDEPDGRIELRIVDDYPNYCASDRGNDAAHYTVLDNDDGTAPADPTVTIAAGDSPVGEGTAAEFTLTRSDSMGTLTVNVSVMESESMIDGTPPTTVEFADGATEATLSVATEDDGVDEMASVITATVEAGTGYAPGTPDSAMVTVTDDDDPVTPGVVTVTIAAVSSPVDEGTAAEFTLTRSDSMGTLTVNVGVMESGSMIDGTAPATVEFADGDATAMLSVATEDDDVDESNSDVTATVMAGTGYEPGSPDSATVTVNDDDETVIAPTGGITIAADMPAGGFRLGLEEGGTASFTLTRAEATAALTVQVGVMETGDMISNAPTMVDFQVGELTAQLMVETVDDDVDEPNSYITASVLAGQDYDVGDPNSAVLRVNDNEGFVVINDIWISVSGGNRQVVEGTDVEFTLFRNNAFRDDQLTVSVDVEETGAVIANAPTTVDFAAGSTTATLTVTTTDDTAMEDDSVVTANVVAMAGYDVGARSSASVTVTDNDDSDGGVVVPPPVDPSLPGVPRNLQRTPGDHQVTLSWLAPDTGGPVTGYQVSVDGGMWMDVPGGADARRHTVEDLMNGRIQADGTIAGPSYSFEVRAMNDAGEGDPAGPVTATPLGPDIEILIMADAATATEGEDVVFTLERIFNPVGGSGGRQVDTTLSVTVMVSVMESGATVSQAPMTVEFDAGQAMATLTVTTDDDNLDEVDSTVTATVIDENSPGYRPGSPDSASTDVMDNDDPPTATIADATVMENDESGHIMFTISLDNSSGREITVDWSTGDDAAAGMYDMAVADTDYTASSGSVTFMPADPAASGQTGETEHTIMVPITNDMLDEHAETFAVTISTQMPDYVTIAEGEMAIGTIEDDDEPPSVMVADMSGPEDGEIEFTVTLDAPSGLPIALGWVTGDEATPDDPYGMATADVDYTAVSDGMVEFVPEAAGMAGPTEMTIAVTVLPDMLDEHDEVFGVTLTPQMPDYVMVGDGMAVGTIEDDDEPPSVMVADMSAMEDEGGITFTVTLDAPSGLPIALGWMTGDEATPDDMYGMATADVDYTSVSDGMVEFVPAAPGMAGPTTMEITVAVVADLLDEHDEVFGVTLEPQMPDYVMVGDGMAVGTIMDDDDPPSVMIADMSGGEDGEIEFTVTLDAPSGLPIALGWMTGDEATPDDMYGMATADVDYTSVSDGMVEFVPEAPGMEGPTTMMIAVTVLPDMLDEHDEVFGVTLEPQMPDYVMVGDGMAVGTIEDDDDPPSVMIADMSGGEDGEIEFTVTLDAPSGLPITFGWSTGDVPTPDDEYGMATADVDYTAVSDGMVEFVPAGAGMGGPTTMMIAVSVLPDLLDEHDEVFGVTLEPQMPDYVMVGDGMAVGTIMDDDDPPTVSILDNSAPEGDENIPFMVNLSAPSGLPISVDWATGDMETPEDMYGMAMADVDYASATGAVKFAPGETAMTVDVMVMDDLLDEHDEVFAVNLGEASYVTVDDGMAVGTILDDDDPPALAIADASAPEADGKVTFTVSLVGPDGSSAPSGLPIGVAWTTGDMETPEDMYGMATAGVDYEVVDAGMVEFAAGETEMTVDVMVMDDALDEHDEVFAVNLGEASYATVDDGMAVGTILDDDDPPALAIADASAPEADGKVTFTVSLVGPDGSPAPSGLPINAGWTTGDVETPDDMFGMATAGVDYEVVDAGTVEFPAGETEMTVDVMVMDDALDEHDEVFGVTVEPAMPAYVDGENSDLMAVGTIEDDDDAPAVTVADASASEGAGPLVFTISLDAPSGLPISVDWATGDMAVPEGSYTMAQADVDYTAAGGTAEFEAGMTEVTVEIELLDDAIDEMDELFAIVLTNPMYAVFGGEADAVTATGTIMDDDDAPSVSIADASALEASGAVTFAVTLDAPSGLPIGVDWATGDMETPDDMYGMATADVDYMSANGTSEFAPGDTEMMVTVTIMDDALDEHDEVFGVTLSNPTYVMVGDGEATGTIEDDDEAPTMSIADASGPESAGSLVFDVTLSAPSGLPIMADYATADGTAVAGEDYAATMGTLNIEPGGTTATVEVSIMDDDYYESAEETFHVHLSGAMYSTLDDGSAVGTIINEDDPPTLAVGDSTATESDGQMTFTITKSGNTRLDATVDWATSDGTATAGEDYASSGSTVTFAPGSTSMSVTVAIMADDRYEGEENFTVTLSGPMMSTLADASATGTITDDDAEAVVKRWLALFGRTVASHVVDAVGGRLTGEPVEASVAQLRLGGYEVGATDAVWGGPSRLSMAGQRPGATGDPLFNPAVGGGLGGGFDPSFGQAWGGASQGPWVGSRNNGFGNLLSRSSFHFSAAGSNPGDSFALWGRGAMTSFSGDDGSLSHDGDVTTGTVGVDFETGQTLFGIGMSHSQGDGEFSGSTSGLAGGNLDSSLTLFHPYVRVNINECTSIWGLVGTGSGDLTLTNGAGGAAIDTDIEMTMGAAGFRGPLTAGLGDFGLEVKSDVFLASMSADSAPGLDSVDAEASRARVALQGSNTTELEGGGLFTPTFEAGLRYDGGDAETGAGVEIGGGLRFADASRRVSLQLNARALLAHSESEYEEWGLGASVVVHPNASGQGVTFNVRTAWGEVASGVDAMWSRYDAAALVDRGERSLARRIGARYDAELGYGINAPGGRNVLVPYVAAGVSDIGTRDYRLGLRLRTDANMDLRFEIDRREGLGFEPDHGVVLRGWLFW